MLTNLTFHVTTNMPRTLRFSGKLVLVDCGRKKPILASTRGCSGDIANIGELADVSPGDNVPAPYSMKLEREILHGSCTGFIVYDANYNRFETLKPF
jgi:hypothetical protein